MAQGAVLREDGPLELSLQRLLNQASDKRRGSGGGVDAVWVAGGVEGFGLGVVGDFDSGEDKGFFGGSASGLLGGRRESGRSHGGDRCVGVLDGRVDGGDRGFRRSTPERAHDALGLV